MRNDAPTICLMRLSAIGDATHAVTLVRALQDAMPRARLTWIVGKVEAKVVGDIAGVEFIVLDKSRGVAVAGDLRRALAGRRFDVLLQCQVALRTNLLSALIRADRRIGYDAARSRDCHGLFVRERIPARTGQHSLDAIRSFAEPLGIVPGPVRWDLPIPDGAHAFAADALPGDTPTLIVSPCSSHPVRNWRAERYAAVADHAQRVHGWRIALCGGRSALERTMADAIIAAMHTPAIDLVGRDTLKQFLALAQRAHAVLTPDSGPMHMANAVGTPVIGLHAASNSRRSGPYSSQQWCVDRYDEAARKFRGKPASELKWGTKIETPGVMDLIETDAVIERIDALSESAAKPETSVSSNC